jgi:hypothetical protein
MTLPGELLSDRARAIRHDIAGVFCGHCFNQYDPAFVVGNRIVHDPLRYNAEFPWKQDDLAIALELDYKASFDNLKELIFVVVLMPRELAL